MKDVPVIEGITTIHFPDIEAAYFRSLLDFLYSGQTCVPAADVEHLHDLLDLLQIKPGIWRTGDKNGKETIEVLTRIFTENNQKLDHGVIDMNCNQGLCISHTMCRILFSSISFLKLILNRRYCLHWQCR